MTRTTRLVVTALYSLLALQLGWVGLVILEQTPAPQYHTELPQ